jgi:hypothetical protein
LGMPFRVRELQLHGRSFSSLDNLSEMGCTGVQER